MRRIKMKKLKRSDLVWVMGKIQNVFFSDDNSVGGWRERMGMCGDCPDLCGIGG
jgi:hypothetical protein